ncbi:MAG: peptidoglycan DD-metalloendopeptidase family protein [Clostridia bacterium]|nr:peptidoglycan DD-metalloendopeptidase family protein [Clostridia bacterium]MBO5299663.1 peptidoglycan DD-metalloendopeptidase family protein [Clostridia bacterium]
MPRSIYSPIGGKTEWSRNTGSDYAVVRKQSQKRKKRSNLEKLLVRTARKLKIDKLLKNLYPLAEFFVEKALPENSSFSVKPKLSHLQHTSFFYRTSFLLRHAAKVLCLFFLGILKTVMPIIIPAAGVAIIVFSIWAASTFSIALDVRLGDEHVAYVPDQQSFDDIRASVENRIYSSGESEYMMESIPTLSFVIIEKDQLTDRGEIAETLYNSYQEYIGQSYGLFIDGQLIGTSKNDADFTRVLDEISSWYLSGEKGEKYSIVNSIEIVRDTYPKNYERSYDELLDLFRTAQNPSVHKVTKNDTLESIAEKYGISVPVLSMLNNSDLSDISSGDNLTVGTPYFELRVQTSYQVTYSEVIPYETKYIYTDSLYEGTTQTKQKGSNGIYEVTAEVREVNGVETYRAEVSQKKVKDAVARQILVGTKTIAPSGKFIWPLANGAGYVSSGFGNRTLRGVANFHRGTDIAAPYGTKILAADAGVVVEYGYQKNGLGNYLAIDHGNGILSYYGHCSSLVKSISKGSKVYQGQVIAYVGSTGNSTGNHVHFALYNTEKKEYFDALPYIS